ncbi:MAG: hypothetical protein WCL29_02430 [Pseudomonadota bacterium]
MTAPRKGKTLSAAERSLRRLYEQGLLIALIAVVVWALLDKARDIRSAAELGAFRYSLGSLRVALVMDRMRTAASFSTDHNSAATNPFLLLAQLPPNYAGDILLADAETGAIVPGVWFFDGHCVCVGYRLHDDSRFFSASGGKLLVFPLTKSGVLAARESYVWRGEVID